MKENSKQLFTISLLLTIAASLFLFPTHVVAQNAETVAAITAVWPDDFDNPDAYVGKTITFNQTFVVTSNSSWKRYGELTISSSRLYIPTELVAPGSNEYKTMAANNRRDQLIIKGYNSSAWVDPDGTIRTGTLIEGPLTGTFSSTRYGYVLTVSGTPRFVYNRRPTTPPSVGAHNVKVCSFNLHIYLASSYGTGYGPDDETEAERHHTKIIAALDNIDADVYGLCEVQTGQDALQKLVNSLNRLHPDRTYAFINDGGYTNGSFTKTGYIYRADKFTPIRYVQSNETCVANRKKAQGFTHNETGEKFVYVMAHYKAKSGQPSGDNADKGDGQGVYNYDRTQEALATVTFARSCATYFGDPDVLITGDLNAYSREDPLTTLYNADYTELNRYFNGDSVYSYIYSAQAGLLDHALANPSLLQQVAGCATYHINSDDLDEFSYYGASYSADFYSSSDHDPLVVGLNLNSDHSDVDIPTAESTLYQSGEYIGIASAQDAAMRIYTAAGQLIATDVICCADFTFSARDYGMRAGVYLINLIKADGTSENHKIVISK